MGLEERLNKYRKLIFLLELAGLLHDIGKLDSRFIDYRRKWQDNIDGWNYNNDPHDDEKRPYFDYDPLLKKSEFKELFCLFSKPLSDFFENSEIWIGTHKFDLNISLKDVIHQHTRASKDSIALFLKLGDSIDSAYDRNNPLLSAEQKEEKIYKSTIFGYETPLDIKKLDILRENVYSDLNRLLPLYLRDFNLNLRMKIFNSIEEAYSNTISDTCRPANDISLWQHAYMTSSLCKVFFNHFLIYGEKFEKFEDCKFSLYGVGWDGLSFLSKGHKIGDIVARKQIIHNLKESIKELIEYKYPIGMNIYDDDNGISFVIPAILKDSRNYEEYNHLLKKIEEDAIEISNDITGGEIYPVFERGKGTHYIMEIVNIIEGLRKKSNIPFYSTDIHPIWVDSWKQDNEVCNVCGKRPISTNKVLCKICEERRVLAQSLRKDKESIFNKEIADRNGRICLIIAKFNILPWLSGDMLWSLFVKEPHNLEVALSNLGKIKDFEKADDERVKKIEKEFGDISNCKYDYTKIKTHIDKCLNPTNDDDKEFAEGISFLFYRHTDKTIPFDVLSTYFKRLDEWLRDVVNKEITINGKTIEERYCEGADIYSYLLTKNHTPSRLLNIWNSTRTFLKDIFESEKIKSKLPPFRRIKLKFENPASSLMPLNNACYEARIGNKNVEIFRQNEDVFIVNPGGVEINIDDEKDWLAKGTRVIIYPSEFEKEWGIKETRIKEIDHSENYIYPYRIITYSPDLLMVLVPAEKALDINLIIYEEYIEKFGKVIGRLPLSIGNIFFKEKTPMFVVLDAGKRMEENFRELYKEYWKEEKKKYLKVTKKENNKIILEDDIEISLKQSLGDGNKDYFHPYFIIKNDINNLENRKSYIKTFLGNLVHFSEIKEGDIIEWYPGYYDFEYLDSTVRRYDIILEHADKNYLKRKSNITQLLSKPYLLEEFKYKISNLWAGIKGMENTNKKLMPGITDTKLRNIEALWLSKLQDWGVNSKEWQKLVEATLKKEFSKYSNPKSQEDREDFEWLKEVIYSGLFFDCLELYLRILKERIGG